MNHFFSSKMWLALDLLICSVWLLITWHENWWISLILFLPFLRIATSLFLYRKSKLSIIPLSILFFFFFILLGLEYSHFNCLWQPFACIVQTICALFDGDVNKVQEELVTLSDGGMGYFVRFIGCLWVLIIPICIYIYLGLRKELTSTTLNKKSIAMLCVYIILAVFFAASIANNYYHNYWLSLSIIVVECLLGLALFFKGDIKHLFTRTEWTYLGTLVCLAVCYCCGRVLSNIGCLALTVLSIACYLLWSWWLVYKKRMSDLLLVSLGTVLFTYSPYTAGFLRIIMLLVSLGCVAWVCIRFALATNSKCVSAVIFILLGMVMPLLSLGYNPFSAIDYQVLYQYREYNSGQFGLLEVHCDEGVGLRDRYGIVIPAEYDKIEVIDPSDPYIKVFKHEKFQIFDIRERKRLSEEWFNKIEKFEYSEHFYRLTSQSEYKRFNTPYWDGDKIVDAQIIDIDSTYVHFEQPLDTFIIDGIEVRSYR